MIRCDGADRRRPSGSGAAPSGARGSASRRRRRCSRSPAARRERRDRGGRPRSPRRAAWRSPPAAGRARRRSRGAPPAAARRRSIASPSSSAHSSPRVSRIGRRKWLGTTETLVGLDVDLQSLDEAARHLEPLGDGLRDPAGHRRGPTPGLAGATSASGCGSPSREVRDEVEDAAELVRRRSWRCRREWAGRGLMMGQRLADQAAVLVHQLARARPGPGRRRRRGASGRRRPTRRTRKRRRPGWPVDRLAEPVRRGRGAGAGSGSATVASIASPAPSSQAWRERAWSRRSKPAGIS